MIGDWLLEKHWLALSSSPLSLMSIVEHPYVQFYEKMQRYHGKAQTWEIGDRFSLCDEYII